MKINPFSPNGPIHEGMFIGRLAELDRLEKNLIQTKAAMPRNFLITGERGIGKTSLLNYFKYVARGFIPIENEQMRFLVVDTEIDQGTTQLGLVSKIELGINNVLAQSEKTREFLKGIWSFIKSIETSALKFRPDNEKQSDELILEQFSYDLARLVERVGSDDANGLFGTRYDGLVILIDEADNASPQLGLGSFFKLLTERLQKRGCTRAMIGLAGLPEVRDVLSASHGSALRIFDELKLDPLTDTEVVYVIESCLKQASEQNHAQYTITDGAQRYLIAISEGYPHFIQQFGYSAFESDTDTVIDLDDVYSGAFGEHGALWAIGDRYYRDDFYKKIQGNGYRQVLRIMAKKLNAWVTKTEIREQFKGKDSILDNAIKALRDRHIILSKEGEKGLYRLQQKGFAMWISLQQGDNTDLLSDPPAAQAAL